MKQIIVLVEGPTEERVAELVLRPALQPGIWLTPVTLKTRRAAGQPANKGGVSKWSRIERELRALLQNPAVDIVTTLLDFYGLPSDAPGRDSLPPDGDPYEQVTHLERAMGEEIADPRFRPFLALHETEAWVLAAAEELAMLLDDPKLGRTLAAQVSTAGGPELVNDGPDTAPSKRLLKACPGYRKVGHGPDAIDLLGLPALRQVCPHLDQWLSSLEGEAL